MSLVERLMGEVEYLEGNKATLKNQFDDIARLVTPNRALVTEKSSPGSPNSVTRFTSIGAQSNALLAATMHGTLTPSTSQWAKMQFRDHEFDGIKEVRDWLQDCDKRMQKALNASNFNSKIHEALLNLGAYGTTSLFCFEKPKDEFGDFKGLVFDSYPIREYNFVLDADGTLIAFYRCFEWSAEQAKRKFSKLAGFKGLGESVEKALEGDTKDKHKQFKFIHAILLRDDIKPGKIDAKNMPVQSVYISRKDKHIISESGFQEMPGTVARWAVNEDDLGWGRSPGWLALPELKSLNEIKKLALKGLQKDISPPILVPHRGLMGGLKVGPNAVNTYAAGRGKPEYFHSGIRWDVTQLGEQDLERQVKEIFLVDKLQLPERNEMTATEVTVRFDMLQRMLGPTFHRINDELFTPVLFRQFQVMLRAGAFLPVPDAILQAQQSGALPELDIVYVGPLAQAQRQQETNAILEVYQSAAMIAQSTGDPSIMDNLDADEALRIIGDQKGLPSKVVRKTEEIEELRAQRQEAMQAQMQMQQASDGLTVAQQAKDLEKDESE